MNLLTASFAIAAAGGVGGMAGAYIGSFIRGGDSGPYLMRIMAGFVLGAVIAGGGTAIALNEAFSSSVQPSDIEKCASAAPENSTVRFTRNEDGSSVCTYEMK